MMACAITQIQTKCNVLRMAERKFICGMKTARSRMDMSLCVRAEPGGKRRSDVLRSPFETIPAACSSVQKSAPSLELKLRLPNRKKMPQYLGLSERSAGSDSVHACCCAPIWFLLCTLHLKAIQSSCVGPKSQKPGSPERRADRSISQRGHEAHCPRRL